MRFAHPDLAGTSSGGGSMKFVETPPPRVRTVLLDGVERPLPDLVQRPAKPYLGAMDNAGLSLFRRRPCSPRGNGLRGLRTAAWATQNRRPASSRRPGTPRRLRPRPPCSPRPRRGSASSLRSRVPVAASRPLWRRTEEEEEEEEETD